MSDKTRSLPAVLRIFELHLRLAANYEHCKQSAVSFLLFDDYKTIEIPVPSEFAPLTSLPACDLPTDPQRDPCFCYLTIQGRMGPSSLFVVMGNLFGKKKTYWVPANRQIAEKVLTIAEWKNAEDFTGWQMQNDPRGLEMILKFEVCENLVEVNLSFNGLGDNECIAIAKAFKASRTLRRADLSNNHIHALGAQRISEALSPKSGEKDPTLEGGLDLQVDF